jgi:hypothetical protein
VQFGELDKARSIIDATPLGHPFTPLAPGFRLLLDADYAGAHEIFSELVESSEQIPTFLYNVVIDTALQAGELKKAQEYILLYNPILARDAELRIDRYTVRDVVKLAYIALKNGDIAGGTESLNPSLPVVQSLPRLGANGLGICDVQILAMLGRREDALMALRAAVDAGFRGSTPYDNWLLEFDPLLDSIRDDARFVAIVSELEVLNDVMRKRVSEAEETGDWTALRALAGST